MIPRRIPLNQRLKRKRHIDIARLQDVVVETIYRVFPKSVLHGGTAIWRCYSGSRFSEDIDMYLEKDAERIDEMFSILRTAGFNVTKKRVKENSLFSKLEFEGTEIRLEAAFAEKRGIVKEYETYEGLLLNIYTLLPEELIAEKVNAYMKRRKVKDLYDIFFLLRHVKEARKVVPCLNTLLDRYAKPLDESDLRALILVGISPEAGDMLGYIRRWLG